MQQSFYDMHENQYVRKAADLGELSAGVAAFMGAPATGRSAPAAALTATADSVSVAW